jgi:hypothetical protein
MISLIHGLFQGLAAAGLATFVVFFGMYAYYDWSPMETWIDYRSVESYRGMGGNEMIRVIRLKHKNDVFVLRLTELQEIQGNEVARYCQWSMVPATDGPLEDRSVYRLHEMIGPLCDLRQLEGKKLMLLVVFDLTLPFDTHKRKPFRVGPYVVTNSRLYKL